MTDLDRLMALDPLELSARDIDEIVAFQREQRAVFESGGKPKKPTGPKKSLDSVVAALRPKVDLPKRMLIDDLEVAKTILSSENLTVDPPKPADGLVRRRL